MSFVENVLKRMHQVEKAVRLPDKALGEMSCMGCSAVNSLAIVGAGENDFQVGSDAQGFFKDFPARFSGDRTWRLI